MCIIPISSCKVLCHLIGWCLCWETDRWLSCEFSACLGNFDSVVHVGESIEASRMVILIELKIIHLKYIGSAERVN